MFRIVDANLNRIGEGLRLLEDFARFSLNDTSLFQRLKSLRHELIEENKEVDVQLLSARDSEGDVGVAGEEASGRNLTETIVANSRRVQESLRVLEETSKLPQKVTALDSSRYKKARFNVYELERELVSKLLRHDNAAKIAGLYVIVDAAFLRGRKARDVAAGAIRGGATVIQWRDKQRDKGESLPDALELRQVCTEYGAVFLVNDHVDLAIAVEADGVHVGQKDLPLSRVRKMVPISMIVGCSTNNVHEAIKAQNEGADYIGVGSIFPTSTKKDTRPAGLKILAEIRAAVSLPIVAIGGINESNIAGVIEAGANSAAVISAVVGADDVEAAARLLISKMKKE